MAISDRITSIEEHIKESYQELEGLGIDTTGVNNNLENIPKLIDGYWETLPKVTGEGTSITLDNTKEGKMKINLKGNTSQATTTQSKNLMPNEAESQTINGLTITKGTDGSLLINGTSTATTKIELGTTNLASGTYTLSTHKEGTTNNSCYLRTIDTTTESEISGTGFNIYSSNSKTYTLSENKKVKFDFYTGGNRTFTNFKIYPMAESGSTATDYVKFVPNSPNPDYPQDIHVVSGNNTINVCGKNLFDKNNVDWIKAYLTSGGTMYTSGNGKYCLGTNEYIKVLPNTTYYLSCSYGSGVGHLSNVFICEYDKDKNNIVRKSHVDNHTFTTESNTQYIRLSWYLFYDANNNMIETNVSSVDTYVTNIQLEYGSTGTTFVPYQSASYPITLPEGMFLGWIPNTDYRDKIDKSSGKNLFNGETELGMYSISAGEKQTNNSTRRNVDFIDVLPNTTYTLSRDGSTFNCRYMYYNENKGYIKTEVVNGSITTPANCYYLNFFSDQLVSNYSNLQLEKGSATSYEPYGNVWYLNKQIGKYTFTGNETLTTYSGGKSRKIVNLINGYTTANNIAPLGYSELSLMVSRISIYNETNYGISYNSDEVYIRLADKVGQDLLDLLEGTNLYYILATPTYTEITDSTLLSQLNALAKSYASQTNISQENNDLASILNATALEEME